MDRAHDRNQIRQLHLLRDERDRELLTAAQSRAGNAVLRVSQLLAAICLLRRAGLDGFAVPDLCKRRGPVLSPIPL